MHEWYRLSLHIVVRKVVMSDLAALSLAWEVEAVCSGFSCCKFPCVGLSVGGLHKAYTLFTCKASKDTLRKKEKNMLCGKKRCVNLLNIFKIQGMSLILFSDSLVIISPQYLLLYKNGNCLLKLWSLLSSLVVMKHCFPKIFFLINCL